MRVLVFEPQYVGHNLAYVRHLTSQLLDLGCEVHLLTSRQAVESEEYALHLGTLLPHLHVTASDAYSTRQASAGVRVNGPRAALALLGSLHRGLCEIDPQHVYIPFGNPVSHWCGFPNSASRWLRQRGVETELVLLFGKYAYPHADLRSKIKERLALAILARGPWTRIHHIVPHAVEVMMQYGKRLSRIVSLLPDPVEPAPRMDRPQARKVLKLPEEGRIASLVGLIERRKGVRELLEAFQSALPRLQSNDRLLLAGKATEEVRHLLSGKYAGLCESGRVVSIDRHLSDEELWAACLASNVICTPYPNHLYSASIVIRAAKIGIPVLANAIGWMEQTIQRFSLGATCDTTNPDVFAAQFASSLESSAAYRPNAMARRFVDFHTTENFALRLTDRVAQRMGARDAYSGVRWEEVTHTASFPVLASA